MAKNFMPRPTDAIVLTINGEEVIMPPKVFSSGSVGWFLGGKREIDGVKVQLSFSAVVVGSRPPDELIDIQKVSDLPSTPIQPTNNRPHKPHKPQKGSKSGKGEKTS